MSELDAWRPRNHWTAHVNNQNNLAQRHRPIAFAAEACAFACFAFNCGIRFRACRLTGAFRLRERWERCAMVRERPGANPGLLWRMTETSSVCVYSSRAHRPCATVPEATPP